VPAHPALAKRDAPKKHNDVVVLDAEIKKTELALDRYLAAFKSGEMPADQCGPRVKALSEKVADLQAKRLQVEYQTELDAEANAGFDLSTFIKHRDAITQLLRTGTNNTRKAVSASWWRRSGSRIGRRSNPSSAFSRTRFVL